MRRSVIRISKLTLGLLIVALGATGCFQAVGAALLATGTPSAPPLDQPSVDATNTAVALQQAGATGQAMVDAITQTAIAVAALPTQIPTEIPFETPTDVGGSVFAGTVVVVPTTMAPPTQLNNPVIGTWTATPFVVIVAPTISFTATPIPTFTPFPTQTPYPTQTTQPTYTPYPTLTPYPSLTPFPSPAAVSVIGTADNSQGSVFTGPTRTPYIPTLDPAMRPVQIAELPTQGPTVMIATIDPAVTAIAQEPTIDPILLQATQIIATITAQAQANIDATSAFLGTPIAPPNQGGGQPIVQPTAATGGIFITTTPQGTWGAPDSGASGPLGADGIYIVQAGDRMIRIALRFNTTVDAIARTNGITNPDAISPGQKLRIPGAVPTSTVPPPNVIAPNAITLAPGATLDPQATIIIITATPPGGSGAAGQVYIVQEGDTLYGIATRFRVSVTALAQYNGIGNISLIYIGQRLTIP